MGDALAQVNEYLDFLFTYGAVWVYVVVFLACFIENLFPPFPGDTFIIAAGGLIALGRLDLWQAYLAVNIGGMLSVMVMYYLGIRYGRNFFLKKDYKYFSAKDILAVEYRLSRWGILILLVSRFVVGFRSALAVAAGIGRYPVAKMVVFSLVSYFAFTGLLMYIGFALVDNLGLIEEYFGKYNQVIWPILILAILLFVIGRYRSSKDAGKSDT
jgi:membrane protein DedA with SNARE-associated domain